jgi:hypothetical protein
MNKNKIPFNKLDDTTKQDIAESFIRNHIYINQSYLVDELFKKEIIHYDDIHNLYFTDGDLIVNFGLTCKEDLQALKDNGEDQQEIFEYWVCSNWLIEQLKELNEPILETDYETWWGRTCTGQAICLDYVIQHLAYKWSNDKRLYTEEVA